MKWFFWGTCALILVIVIRSQSYFCDGNSVPEYEPQVPAVTTSGGESELIDENARLKEHIAQLNKQIEQLKYSAKGNYPSQQSIASSHAFSDSTEPKNLQAKIQEFNSLLTHDDSIASLKTSFASEAVDGSWANTHQHEIEDFFRNSFTDVFPQYIECRSKLCKITVPVSDQKQFSALSQELTQAILNNKGGIPKSIVIEPMENNGTLNFYLSRNDEVNFLQ